MLAINAAVAEQLICFKKDVDTLIEKGERRRTMAQFRYQVPAF
jgi:hypothetical protein